MRIYVFIRLTTFSILFLCAVSGFAAEYQSNNLIESYQRNTFIAKDLVGSYVNIYGETRNYFQLASNGKGAILTINSRKQWTQVMGFDWSVDGAILKQRNIVWSSGQKYYGSPDSKTNMKFESGVLYTLSQGGEWLRWDRSNMDVMGEISKSIGVMPQRRE